MEPSEKSLFSRELAAVMDLIDHFEENPLKTDRIRRFRIHFKNGYQLSVLLGYEPIGQDHFGFADGMVEIAAFNWDGSMDSTLIGLEHPQDTIREATDSEMIKYIKQVGMFPSPSVSAVVAAYGKALWRIAMRRIRKHK